MAYDDMDIPAIPPERVTNGQLYAALLNVSRQQRDIYRKQIEQGVALTELRSDFETHVVNQKEMVNAWTAAKGTLGFLKLLASIGVPVGAVVAWILNKG